MWGINTDYLQLLFSLVRFLRPKFTVLIQTNRWLIPSGYVIFFLLQASVWYVVTYQSLLDLLKRLYRE